ncbi:MAG: response regulator [Bdellovibrionota bacterium]
MKKDLNSKSSDECQGKIVLIDDDLSFCQIMKAYASVRGWQLDAFVSLEEMGSIGKLSEYTSAIVDYNLKSMNGLEIAEYLPAFFGEMPMILVSGSDQKEKRDNPWPNSIKAFVHKCEGPEKILDVVANYLPKDKEVLKVC